MGSPAPPPRVARPQPQRTTFSTHVVARRGAGELAVLLELQELALFFDVRPYSDRYEWVLVGPAWLERHLSKLLFYLELR